MDEAVAGTYGWTDLRLDHGFHQTEQGSRFTISEAALVEVLDKLLELNHKCRAEEEKLGLHEKGNNKKRTKKSAKRQAVTSEGASAGIKRQPELSTTSDQKGLFED